MKASQKLCLGTVQFGIPYGSRKIQVPRGEVLEILDAAKRDGIHMLDTAPAYGQAERIVGEICEEKGCQFKVYTKYMNSLECGYGSLKISLEKSMETMRQSQLEGCFLHREEDIRNKDVLEEMRDCVQNGLIKEFGVSVYSPEKAIEALDLKGLSVIQIPFNILDKRWEQRGFFQKAAHKNVKVFVRSIFLQGVLLMPKELIPEAIRDQVWPHITRIQKEAQAQNMTTLQYLLLFVSAMDEIDGILFGIESLQQYTEVINAFSQISKRECDFEHVRKHFERIPEKILNPSMWS